VGREYGVTTGRPRRCGWFDAAAMRFAVMVNGVDCLCITKIDCLDDFDEIKVGTQYAVDGEPLRAFPGTQRAPQRGG